MLQQGPLSPLLRRAALLLGLHCPCAPPPPRLPCAGGLWHVGARFPELTPCRPHHLLIARVQVDGAGSPQGEVRGPGHTTRQPQRPARAAVAGSLVVMATVKQGWRACSPGSLAPSTCSLREPGAGLASGVLCHSVWASGFTSVFRCRTETFSSLNNIFPTKSWRENGWAQSVQQLLNS